MLKILIEQWFISAPLVGLFFVFMFYKYKWEDKPRKGQKIAEASNIYGAEYKTKKYINENYEGEAKVTKYEEYIDGEYKYTDFDVVVEHGPADIIFIPVKVDKESEDPI